MTLKEIAINIAEVVALRIYAGGEGSGWFRDSANPHVAKVEAKEFLKNMGFKFDRHSKGVDHFVRSAVGRDAAIQVVKKGDGKKEIAMFVNGKEEFRVPNWNVGVMQRIAMLVGKTFAKPDMPKRNAVRDQVHNDVRNIVDKLNDKREAAKVAAQPVGSGTYAKIEHDLQFMPIVEHSKLGNTASSPKKVVLADGTHGVFKDDRNEPCGARHIGCGQQGAREAGAWEIAKIVGMTDMLTPTVKRDSYQNGRTGVISKWLDNTHPPFRGMKDVDNKSVARAAVFDYVIGNTDRHNGNWLLTSDNNVKLIDHGLSFPPDNNRLALGRQMFEDGHSKFFQEATARGLKVSEGNVDVYKKNKEEIQGRLVVAGLPAKDIAATMVRIDTISSSRLGTRLFSSTKLDRPRAVDLSMFVDRKPFHPGIHAAGTQSKFKLEAKYKFQGLNICIENKKGSIRSGKEPNGKPWSIKMPFDYGYISSTKGTDRDEVDCFIGPNRKADHVYIVHQRVNAKGAPQYDEDKCFLGWDSPDAAKKAYHSAYKNVDLFHSMTMMPLKEFKEKLNTFSGKKLHASLQAGGPGSGRHKDFALTSPKLQVVKRAKEKHEHTQEELVKSGMSKKWKHQSEEERHAIAQHNLSQVKLFAGGPGSGRHPWGRKAKPSKQLKKLQHRTKFLQKHNQKNADYLKKKYNETQQKNKAEGKNARGKEILSTKQHIAVKNVVIISKAQQDKAEQGEQLVTKALHGEQQHNNSPMDVTLKLPNGKIMGLEVKSMLQQKQDRIYIKGNALTRKVAWGKTNKAPIGTVALDFRTNPDKPDVYYKSGVGAFHIGSMSPVQGGLKGLAVAIGGK